MKKEEEDEIELIKSRFFPPGVAHTFPQSILFHPPPPPPRTPRPGVPHTCCGTPGAPDDEVELRAAALATLSPMLVMSLHQELLGGVISAPIDSSATMRHLQGWLNRGVTSA